MRTATRVAEGLSALILLMAVLGNPHHDATVYLVAGISTLAAAFVAAVFPRKPSPVVALVLAPVVVLSVVAGPLRGSGGGEGLHSPIMGIGALLNLVLLLAQVVAVVGSIRALNAPQQPGSV